MALSNTNTNNNIHLNNFLPFTKQKNEKEQ